VLGTPKLAQIFAYGKWLYPYEMQLHGASDLDQRCLKARDSQDGCTFPPNIFALTPNISPKPHFGGPFNAKPIVQIALRKSHVNGAPKVKLYSYIGIGKYLKNVPLYFLRFATRKRFGPMNLFVIAHCAFMFKFIIRSQRERLHATGLSICSPY